MKKLSKFSIIVLISILGIKTFAQNSDQAAIAKVIMVRFVSQSILKLRILKIEIHRLRIMDK